MARGIGYILNIEIPCNFNSPYKAKSITEFWDRWHLTLTKFLRTYIYFTLGGNRKGVARSYLNIMIMYLVSGIWHGANWTFIVWGIIHGVANCLNRVFNNLWEMLPGVIRWGLTFGFVNIAWIFFHSDSVGQVFEMFERFTVGNLRISYGLVDLISMPEYKVLLKIPGMHTILSTYPEIIALVTIVLFIWASMSFAGESMFLYFNF